MKALDCPKSQGYEEILLAGADFYLRPRGDIVLENFMGARSGLRIEDFCISHSLDDASGEVVWEAHGCVPPPVVPACCPPGTALDVNNQCRDVDVTAPALQPPIHADPYQSHAQPATWRALRQHHNPLNCSDEPMTRIPLDGQYSYLAAHPSGLLHLWWAPQGHQIRQSPSHDFCVGAESGDDGVVEHYVALCYEPPQQRLQRLCEKDVCFRQCCGEDEVMLLPAHLCVPKPSEELRLFRPEMSVAFRTIDGIMDCHSEFYDDFTIDPSTGELLLQGGAQRHGVESYCVASQLQKGATAVVARAAVCDAPKQQWEVLHQQLLPWGMAVSIAFLLLVSS